MNSGPQDVKGHEILQQVAAQALDDAEFRRQLLDDPKSVLREAGLQVDDSINLVVHENTANDVHLVLPAQPTEAAELSLDETDLGLLIATMHF